MDRFLLGQRTHLDFLRRFYWKPFVKEKLCEGLHVCHVSLGETLKLLLYTYILLARPFCLFCCCRIINKTFRRSPRGTNKNKTQMLEGELLFRTFTKPRYQREGRKLQSINEEKIKKRVWCVIVWKTAVCVCAPTWTFYHHASLCLGTKASWHDWCQVGRPYRHARSILYSCWVSGAGHMSHSPLARIAPDFSSKRD